VTYTKGKRASSCLKCKWGVPVERRSVSVDWGLGYFGGVFHLEKAKIVEGREKSSARSFHLRYTRWVNIFFMSRYFLLVRYDPRITHRQVNGFKLLRFFLLL